ncbi:DMT family transporter [Anoxynatronum buryatiense]|uniref:Transporter family-2 protein n=1 Tax=Anoxynatronum buryatiense TaxID=489973 RepID=A0AA45WVW5_9CLOT|nr:DMT family transporter [Anoxynatronum buryatiense]SMP56132.1 transporter family-2 protein [Anoxynatronum buryatiense]
MGILYAILAGLFISLQSVFNTRLGEKVGLWETTAIVHATGLLVAMAILTRVGWGGLSNAFEVNRAYLLGGAFGVVIVYSVMNGIGRLGAAQATTIILMTQLLSALAMDTFGLFGLEQVPLTWTKPAGLLVILAGILIFKIV